MKLQCHACDKEEAEVLCCADGAVLCKGCDAKVHAANKLSQKYHRLFLLNHFPTTTSNSSFSSSSSSSSQLPLCDICQERKGYVFCLEDRALLCRDCDLSTHAATSYAFTHQRFLISGIKVALDSSAETSSSYIGSGSRNNHHTRSPMPVDCSCDFPASEATAVATRMEMETASTETAATFPLPAETGFAAETNWVLHDHIYYANDFIFYDFSDVASSKIDDQ